jgi:FKBP-type peptidyl-prolyl cis-trans isomerase
MRLLLFLALGCTLILPVALHAQREKLSPDDLDFVQKKWPQALQTNTGIRYIIEKEGTGDPPNPGDIVTVLYVGTFLDGTKFDEDTDRSHPFSFRVGRSLVIEGWDEVLQLMKPGEKRLVIIPSELAYGTRGRIPGIPRDTTLVFDLELVKVDRENLQDNNLESSQ